MNLVEFIISRTLSTSSIVLGASVIYNAKMTNGCFTGKFSFVLTALYLLNFMYQLNRYMFSEPFLPSYIYLFIEFMWFAFVVFFSESFLHSNH